MGGLQRLFLRITPIIMLICFICFGITHAFQQANQPNITYLTHEVITVNDNGTPNDLTDDTTIDNYTFDVQSYANNININILKRSVNNTLNIDAFKTTINGFRTIWNNGYQVGDVLRSVANGILLIANILIAPINIILIPLRITSGILLTAFSISGININRQTPILNLLNNILDNAAIPMFGTTAPRQEYQDSQEQLEGIWEIDKPTGLTYAEIEFNFYMYFDEILCKKMIVDNGTITFITYSTNEEIVVYTNGQWNSNYNNPKVIDITGAGSNSYQVLQLISQIATKWDE